jgi:hypothetical protein
MKNNFIELTDANDEKVILNAMFIISIEPDKNDSVKLSLTNFSFPRKFKESYAQVKALINSQDL